MALMTTSILKTAATMRKGEVSEFVCVQYI